MSKVTSKAEKFPAGTNTAGNAPAAASLYLARAVGLHLEGKGGEALLELERALTARDDLSGETLVEIYSAVGFIHFERKEFERAAEGYRKALEVGPCHPSACYNLALCLQALGQWQSAIDQFNQALAVDPNRHEANLGLGACCLQLGAAREALDAYERCLRQDPELEEAQLGKAVALQMQKKLLEAGEIYRNILDKNPRSEECLSNAILVAGELKDYAAVQKFAEQLLAIRPGSLAAAEGLATVAFPPATTKRLPSGALRWSIEPRTALKVGSTWVSPARKQSITRRPWQRIRKRSSCGRMSRNF
jgi:tetratricopeptide (TPR) repeat protein